MGKNVKLMKYWNKVVMQSQTAQQKTGHRAGQLDLDGPALASGRLV